jgi:hypothetical protein
VCTHSPSDNLHPGSSNALQERSVASEVIGRSGIWANPSSSSVFDISVADGGNPGTRTCVKTLQHESRKSQSCCRGGLSWGLLAPRSPMSDRPSQNRAFLGRALGWLQQGLKVPCACATGTSSESPGRARAMNMVRRSAQALIRSSQRDTRRCGMAAASARFVSSNQPKKGGSRSVT